LNAYKIGPIKNSEQRTLPPIVNIQVSVDILIGYMTSSATEHLVCYLPQTNFSWSLGHYEPCADLFISIFSATSVYSRLDRVDNLIRIKLVSLALLV
jgi:hypothetical protein